jgi:predicted DNA-binding transcriptional regulator AlpA
VDTNNKLLTEAQASDYLSLKAKTLSAWRLQGRGPKFVAFSSRAVRYRISDLEAFLKSCTRETGGDRDAR